MKLKAILGGPASAPTPAPAKTGASTVKLKPKEDPMTNLPAGYGDMGPINHGPGRGTRGLRLLDPNADAAIGVNIGGAYPTNTSPGRSGKKSRPFFSGDASKVPMFGF